MPYPTQIIINKIVFQYKFFPSDSLIKKKSTPSQIKYIIKTYTKEFKIWEYIYKKKIKNK